MIPGSSIPILMGETTYLVQKSLRFSRDASAHLSRTPSVNGNQQKMTFSWWMKLGEIPTNNQARLIFASGAAGSNPFFAIGFNDLNNAGGDVPVRLSILEGTSSVLISLATTMIFRDISAWYHCLVSFDTTQATSTNRVILYVNGVQQTLGGTTTYGTSGVYPSQNASINYNTTTYSSLIGKSSYTAQYFDGYLSEVYFIDGQALTPGSFGQTDNVTGVWVPKKYTGTYGTNGFYLEFKDASAATNTAIGKDSSGNENHWTPSAISVTSGNTFDQMVDTPTLNYPTLSMIDKSAAVVVNRSTLKITGGSAGGLNTFSQTGITFNLPTYGKWYFEFKRDNTGADANGFGVNITRNYRGGNGWPATRNNDGYPGYYSFEYGFAITHDIASNNLTWRNNFIVTGASVATNSTSSTATTAVYGFAVDCDNNLAYMYENGTLKTNSNGLSFVHPGANAVVSIFKSDHIVSANFGQQPFAYTPPTGFVALNSNNLLTPTIQKSSLYFDTITYTGNGSTSNVSITGTSFTPDTIWFKRRDSTTNGIHVLIDSSRFSGLITANTYISNTALYWKSYPLTYWQFGLDATGTGVRGGGSLGTNVRTGTYYDVDIDANTPFEIEYQLRGIDTANAQGTVAIYRKQDQANIGTTLTNYFALGMFSATSTHWVGGLDPASTIGLAYIHSAASVDAAEEKSANLVSLTSNVATTNVFVLAREADGNLKAYRTNAAGSRVLIKTHSEKTNSIMRIAINSSAEGNFLGLQYLKVNLLGGVTSTAKRYAAITLESSGEDEIEEELVSFNSDGFTIKNSGNLSRGSGLQITSRLNINTASMVSWAWKKDPSSGFDVVTYSGTGANTNVSHSLGVAPSMIIVKQRAANTAVKTTNWAVWHKDIANTSYILLNSQGVSATGSTYWNNITPNSTTFSVGTSSDTNGDKGLYIAYLWSEVAGFSRFGSYTGNGSTDGPFVWCGFRPAWVLTKRVTSVTGNWYLWDNKRIIRFNGDAGLLVAEAATVEADYNTAGIDLLSNGFKLRNADSSENASGGAYIFAAFAETPFKYARAR